MLTSSEFFEAFDEAGFLKLASWTPSGGGTTKEAQVRYRGPSTDILGDAVRATDHEITYVTDQLPGLAEGERLVIDGETYRVRQKPERQLDGSISRADLALVVL
jgi:hypothetical protein